MGAIHQLSVVNYLDSDRCTITSADLVNVVNVFLHRLVKRDESPTQK